MAVLLPYPMLPAEGILGKIGWILVDLVVESNENRHVMDSCWVVCGNFRTGSAEIFRIVANWSIAMVAISKHWRCCV